MVIAETSFPAHRGKETTEEVLEVHTDAILQEAKHRRQAQKAVVALLARDWDEVAGREVGRALRARRRRVRARSGGAADGVVGARVA